MFIGAGWAGKAAATTVQFFGWGGSPQVNQYLQWVSEQTQARYDIKVNHVKLADTSDAVTRVLGEKAAGNSSRGSIDLLWINGENFAAMKQHNLLLSDWAEQLPNFALTRPDENPSMRMDFGIATDGQEAPWGKAALVFYFNQRLVSEPPASLAELLEFARQNPGRFTYPLPDDFLGISFLKYAALSLNAANRQLLYAPVTDPALATITGPLFTYLDKLHPLLWQQGEFFVRQASMLQQLFSDNEILLAFSFTAAEIPAAVSRFDLPQATRTYAMHDGSLSNVHFVAIPFNSARTDAAKTVANFLLSPEAQAYKQRVSVWGDETVLSMEALSKEQQQQFQTQSHPAALAPGAYQQLLAEPHASWAPALRDAWYARYGARL
ncbi:ABC transporter substrate-binding protein [Salinimonas marina]|uniref:ABC transporter substrate-binding protein n=2 Tax=Salinimonas marina TaxID=2785918 RepID=A0A7S9HEF4_9ALTE|nr:ABC transporter substrate-binding protein [Salinimonas marina]